MALPLLFPTLPSGKNFDSSKFSVSRADPGMRAEMEGGYVVTRARFTRPPPKRWKLGLTSITNADRLVLDDFWVTTRGTSRAFTWTCNEDLTQYNVRFKGEMVFRHVGIGNTHLWDCDLELEQL